MTLSRRLAPILFLPLACTAASDTSTTTSDGSTTHAEGSASTHEDPTGHATHASHTGSTGATTGATTGMTTGDVTTHATHDSHASHDTHATHTTTDTTDTQASTSSTGSTDGGDPPPVTDYCACMLENCHDQYHATWGEDHVAAEAMCTAAAESLPSVGMPATDGNSLECRYYYCQLGHDDPAACDSAIGGGSCV
jgi:hypothetical protein